MKRFAIPVENGQLCNHFGHCQEFAIIQVDDNNTIHEDSVTPPPHEPGLLPKWLNQKEVTHVIAAGIGQRAINLLNQHDIQVTVGVQTNTPKELVEEWLSNSLVDGTNTCDH